MKKLMACLLAMVMILSLAACGTETPAETEAAKKVEGTMEELLNKVIEQEPVEFMGAAMPVDLTDNEMVLWLTGLENADKINDACVFEPMMSSIAFSIAMVRVNEGEDAKAVAESMKSGVDPRKWVCVEADDMVVAGFGDVVMLAMVASDSGLTAQSYVDAFAAVCGFAPDFTI